MLFSVSCVSSFCLADMLLLTSKQGPKILMTEFPYYYTIIIKKNFNKYAALNKRFHTVKNILGCC